MNNPTMQRYTGFFDINNYSIPGEIVKNPSSGIIKLKTGFRVSYLQSATS